jgi:hypothetical protein
MIEKSYRIERGEYDSLRIVQTGRCSSDLATIAEIEGGCTRRFSLETIPMARGVIFKPLDGTMPTVVQIAPPTMAGRKYNCVKVDGRVTPFAPLQPGGAFTGTAVLQYEIIWQQVGAI